MPTIEVDEEEFRANSHLRKQIGAWMKIPAARRKLLEANRAADPKADIPELDKEDQLEQRVAPLATEVESLKKALADEKASREQEKRLGELSGSIEHGITKLRREHGLTDEGVTAVRKIMEEEGITKPEIAWAHFVQLHPPQSLIAAASGSGAWNFMEPPGDEQADLKRLMESKGESDAIVNKLARDALADIRGQR